MVKFWPKSISRSIHPVFWHNKLQCLQFKVQRSVLESQSGTGPTTTPTVVTNVHNGSESVWVAHKVPPPAGVTHWVMGPPGPALNLVSNCGLSESLPTGPPGQFSTTNLGHIGQWEGQGLVCSITTWGLGHHLGLSGCNVKVTSTPGNTMFHHSSLFTRLVRSAQWGHYSS